MKRFLFPFLRKESYLTKLSMSFSYVLRGATALGNSCPFAEDQTFDVVNEIYHTVLDSGAGNADCSNK